VAENDDQDSKTEAASDRRLQKAYEDGQVPVGRDLINLCSLGGGALALVTLGPTIRDRLLELFVASLDGVPTASLGILAQKAAVIGALVLAVCGSAALAAIVATVAQTRGGVWAELAVPDFTRVFSGGRLSRLIKIDFLVDMGMAVLKMLGIGYVAWLSLRDSFMTLKMLPFKPIGVQVSAIFGPLGGAAVKVLTALIIVAGIDFAIQRQRFNKKMKMSKDELKREYKEDEGDPTMKGRRKRKARELAKNRAKREVPRADALLVNPTHIAIAIRYRKSQGKAPRVMAKGKGQIADMMRELAREHNIPIYKDIPLARLLYKKVKVGREVPMETYKAVAAILAFVYRVTGRQPGTPRLNDTPDLEDASSRRRPPRRAPAKPAQPAQSESTI
jgi:flagellar biosynthetic protein FlhB